MVDIFASTGINPAEQMPPAESSNAELGNVGPTSFEQMASQTPKFAPIDAISNLAAMEQPPADMSQGDISQPVVDGVANAAQGTPTPEQPANNLEVGNNLPDLSNVQPNQPTFEGGARDLLKAHDIAAPSILESNQAAFNNGVDINNPQGPEQQAVADYANDVNKQYNTIAQTRYTPDQQQALKDKGPVDFFEMFSKLQPVNIGPAPMGMGPTASAVRTLFSGTVAANQLKDIADKANSGQPLTDAEHGKLQDYIDNQVELNQRGVSWWGKAAQMTAGLPSVLLSFAAAPEIEGPIALGEGAGMLAKAGATVGNAAAVGTARAAFMPAMYIPQYGEIRLNDSIAVTDKGDMIYKTAQESPALAALKAFGYTAATSVAQEFAGPIGGAAEKLATAAVKPISPILNSAVSKLPVPVQDAIFQAYKTIQPNATLSTALSAAGWHGVIGQLGANRVSDALQGALNLATDKNYTFDDYLKALVPTPEQFSLEAALVSVAGGVHVAGNLAMNIMAEKGVKPSAAAETLQNMSALEKESFVNQNTPNPTSLYPEVGAPTENQMRESQMADLERQHDALPVDDPQRVQIQQKMGELANQIVTPPVATPEDIRTPIYADAMQIDGARAAKQLSDPPLIQEDQSSFNKVYRTSFQKWYLPIYSELFNDIEAIQELSGVARKQGATVLDGEDSKLLANAARMTPKLIEYNVGVSTAHFDETGNLVETGKGLKSVYDDLDNVMMDIEPDRLQRHKDFSDYQVAQSLVEDQAKGRLEITPKQQGKYVDNLLRLAQKYGDKYQWMDRLAQENYEWRNRILQNLVRTGEWTQEKYDQTVAERSKYAPLGRILPETTGEDNAVRPISRGGLGQDPNPRSIGSLKQRGEGNDLEIRDTFKSDILNAARIIQKSSVNNLLRSMYKFKDFYPDDVKEVQPNIKSAEVTGAYDPKLRAKLEQTVEQLGGSVERVKKMESVSGLKNTLGSYDPMENLVKLKLGTTEGTLAHEVGHLLDEKLGLKDKMLSDPAIKDELQKLAEDRLNSDISLREGDATDSETRFQEQRKPVRDKYLNYVKSDPEVLANFFDAYVNAPEQVDSIAPKAKAAFDSIVDADPKLAFLKEIKPSTVRATEMLKPREYDYNAPDGAIPFYENGQRKFMGLSPEIYKAFNNFSPHQMGTVEKFLRATLGTSAKILREGATMVPSFMFQHLERAVFSSFLNSEGKATPVDFAKGMWDVMGKSQEYKKWAASSGALQNFMPLDEKGLDKAYTDMFKEQNIENAIKAALPTVREVSDYSGRVAVYEKYKAEGVSDLRAGMMSLEATGNYTRGGTLTRKLNPYIPFLNDTVQGADRFMRSYAKNPATYTLRALGMLTLGQVALTGYYLYGADDKTRKEYLRFPEYERKEFYLFKAPGTEQWVKIRRPFAPGYLFGYVPESIMLHAYNNNMPEGENFYKNLFSGAASSLVPVTDISRVMPPVIRAYIQTQSNYDFFKEKPIFNDNPYHPVASAQQVNTGTSETAKLIGKTFDISPAKFDANVDTLTGTAGRKFLLPATDAAIEKIRELGGENVPAKPTSEAADSILGGTVLARTPDGYASQPAIDFFKNYDELQKQYNSLPKGTNKYDRQAAAPGYQALDSARKEMSAQNKEIKDIVANPSMSADDKAEQIKVRQDNIASIAERANQQYYQQRGNK